MRHAQFYRRGCAVLTNGIRPERFCVDVCDVKGWNIRSRRIVFFAFLLIPLLLSGCAGNVIHLSYPALQAAGPSGAVKDISVCVIDFDNKRTEAVLGKRLNGDDILPRTPVERWLATSLAEELGHAGYRVSTAEDLTAALAMRPDYIIAGEAEEVWLAETSFTRYTGTIRASITLLDGQGGHLTTNVYNCIYSKTVLPIYGVPQTLLADALQEMLLPAVKLLGSVMQ